MRRLRRSLAVAAVAAALAAVPVALAGAEPPSIAPAGAESPSVAPEPAASRAATAAEPSPNRGVESRPYSDRDSTPRSGPLAARAGRDASVPSTAGMRPRSHASISRATAAAARAALERARRPSPARYVRVHPGRVVALRAAPGGGRTVARVRATTELGERRVLGVVRRRGRWLGVTTHLVPNGRLAWVDARDPALARGTTRWSIAVDLSERRLMLRRDGRAVRSLPVAVGAPGSPTPTGRFAVTDVLDGTDYGPYYGCCVLALSATQPNLPPGWTGGNRMAIHGTDAPASIGAATSAGCLRASDADLRALTARARPGTPVVIRR